MMFRSTQALQPGCNRHQTRLFVAEVTRGRVLLKLLMPSEMKLAQPRCQKQQRQRQRQQQEGQSHRQKHWRGRGYGGEKGRHQRGYRSQDIALFMLGRAYGRGRTAHQ